MNGDNSETFMDHDGCFLSSNIDAEDKDNPFVNQPRSLKNSSTSLDAKDRPEQVATTNALDAVKAIESSSDSSSLPTTLNDGHTLLYELESFDRVELLENIERAILNRKPAVEIMSDGTEPEKVETFPILEDHSRHWTLNEKQHMAFECYIVASCFCSKEG